MNKQVLVVDDFCNLRPQPRYGPSIHRGCGRQRGPVQLAEDDQYAFLHMNPAPALRPFEINTITHEPTC